MLNIKKLFLKELNKKDGWKAKTSDTIKVGTAIKIMESLVCQLEPLVSLRATSAIKLLDTINAYYEHSMREHCYKFSIKDLPCLIVTAETQEEAALKMVAKIQKHLSESK